MNDNFGGHIASRVSNSALSSSRISSNLFLKLPTATNGTISAQHDSQAWLLFTEIGPGTPSQYFQVLVDISATDGFVISSEYRTSVDGSQKDSSPSSTYREGDLQ